ncbi:MAG: DUF4410 domain-containing protein [Candidatus Rokuibacteriota bacterium]
MSRRHLATALVLLALAAGGCIGSYKASVVDPRGVSGLAPTVEDPDVGLVGAVRGFDLRPYTVIGVARFDVNKDDVKDDEDRNLAAAMPDYFQSEIVRRLRASGIFERVINLTEREYTPGTEQALRLEGTITRLAPGNRALRYLIGFGAGAAKAQAETRFVDVQTGKVVLVTADRRKASFGIFGGDSEEHLQEAFSDMARDLAKYLVRLRAQPAATAAAVAAAPAAPSAQSLVGTWRGTLRVPPASQASGPRTWPVVLQVADASGGVSWQLARTDQAHGVIARGTVEATRDGVRLSGTYDQETFVALGGQTLPQVKVTYTGAVAADTFDATGITGDQRVYVLSVRRAGP